MSYMSPEEIVEHLHARLTSVDLDVIKKTDRETWIIQVYDWIEYEYKLSDAPNPYTLLNYQPMIENQNGFDVDVNPRNPVIVAKRIAGMLWDKVHGIQTPRYNKKKHLEMLKSLGKSY